MVPWNIILQAILNYVFGLFGKERQAKRVEAAEQAVANAPTTLQEEEKALDNGKF